MSDELDPMHEIAAALGMTQAQEDTMRLQVMESHEKAAKLLETVKSIGHNFSVVGDDGDVYVNVAWLGTMITHNICGEPWVPCGAYAVLFPGQTSDAYFADTDAFQVPAGRNIKCGYYSGAYGWVSNGTYYSGWVKIYNGDQRWCWVATQN